MEIISGHNTRAHITRYFEDSLWSDLESIIGDIVNDLPPMCFYIDSIDEEFGHAPMYWLRAQKGLFYECMRLLRDSKLGGRLHLFICVRDLVLSSIYRSEHQTRYRGEPHIRTLNWNYDAIKYFLEKKIESLPVDLINKNERGKKSLKTWIGTEIIKNTTRGIEEPIYQYLIRHTRLLPRDIIILGNKLSQKIRQNRMLKKEFDHASIREVVNEVSKIFGNEQLAICGNQISSNLMPEHAAQHGYSNVYTGDKEHSRGLTQQLKLLIQTIGKDKFRSKEMDQAKLAAESLFQGDSDAFSVLWQNGLLGYCETHQKKVSVVFYSEDHLDDFNLPLGKKQYVFHPVLAHS
ncbi:MAG: hypothetical protein KAH06_05530, partial [Desulfobacterales bacterium]|nr:hypothetical protein [Desulfobacterales bacterium]